MLCFFFFFVTRAGAKRKRSRYTNVRRLIKKYVFIRISFFNYENKRSLKFSLVTMKHEVFFSFFFTTEHLKRGKRSGGRATGGCLLMLIRLQERKGYENRVFIRKRNPKLVCRNTRWKRNFATKVEF